MRDESKHDRIGLRRLLNHYLGYLKRDNGQRDSRLANYF